MEINPKTVEELREIEKEMGEITDNVIIRLIMDEYKRLKVENELLRMKFKKYEE